MKGQCFEIMPLLEPWEGSIYSAFNQSSSPVKAAFLLTVPNQGSETAIELPHPQSNFAHKLTKLLKHLWDLGPEIPCAACILPQVQLWSYRVPFKTLQWLPQPTKENTHSWVWRPLNNGKESSWPGSILLSQSLLTLFFMNPIKPDKLNHTKRQNTTHTSQKTYWPLCFCSCFSLYLEITSFSSSVHIWPSFKVHLLNNYLLPLMCQGTCSSPLTMAFWVSSFKNKSDTAMIEMHNQQGPTVPHTELCSTCRGSLDGRGQTHVCEGTHAWAPHSSSETTPTLLISCTRIQNK